MSNKTHTVTLYFIKDPNFSSWPTDYPFAIINRFRDIVYELELTDVIDVNTCDVTKKLDSIHLKHFKYSYDWYPYIEIVTNNKKLKLSGIRKNMSLDKLMEECNLLERFVEYQKRRFVVVTQTEPTEIVADSPVVGATVEGKVGPNDYEYDSGNETNTTDGKIGPDDFAYSSASDTDSDGD